MKTHLNVYGLIFICLIAISFIGCAEDTGNGNGGVTTVLTAEDKLQGSYTFEKFKMTINREVQFEDGPPEATGNLTLSSGGSYTMSINFMAQSKFAQLSELVGLENPSDSDSGAWSADSTHLTLGQDKWSYFLNGPELSITMTETEIEDGKTNIVSITVTWKKV